ncbi:MAG: Asp-tRNA(Asn)/Glu-tRNA(Gln) amidotransferase subunit GatB [Phycisphaeraceae bacterium]|nr:Asp-tRNA(Asn)/Glu-tRNA(Gln) amidotransferase subunit GatB [Phycisphaeraceae bacterium]
MASLNTRLMVGMEVHVELCTRSKMWTSAPNVAHPDFDAADPNTLTNPVVIGMPGTLPVMNRAAVEMSIKVGLALGCKIAGFTKWDRKSYYYPDLPKNYQISQYDQPLCEEGAVEIPVSVGTGLTESGSDGAERSGLAESGSVKTIRIIRAHLEEDAGKLLHEAPGGIRIDHSIVDLNRAGTPLLEIVTYPDMSSADECVAFARTLRDICRHLGVTQGIMQKGHIRFEPNINVIIESGGQTYKTPIVEIKNLNSFKAVHGAVTYEHQRQVEEWQETGKVMGERAKTTRGWDDTRMVTTLQRAKEDADEYRYFPDPDLVPVVVDDAWRESIAATIGELPLARRSRYVAQLGLPEAQADALIDEPAVCAFFEDVLSSGGGSDVKKAAAVMSNNVQKLANERGKLAHELGISAAQLAGVLQLLAEDKIASNAVDALLSACCDSDETAEKLAEKQGLLQVSDTGALEGFVDQALADPRNDKAINDIREGKDKAIGSLMGQVMKLSQGSANPKLVRELIIRKLRG